MQTWITTGNGLTFISLVIRLSMDKQSHHDLKRKPMSTEHGNTKKFSRLSSSFPSSSSTKNYMGKGGIDACYFSTTLVKGNENKNDAVNLMKKDADQASIYSTKEHHPFKCVHAIMQPSGTIKNYRLICDWCVHKQSNLLGYAGMT